MFLNTCVNVSILCVCCTVGFGPLLMLIIPSPPDYGAVYPHLCLQCGPRSSVTANLNHKPFVSVCGPDHFQLGRWSRRDTGPLIAVKLWSRGWAWVDVYTCIYWVVFLIMQSDRHNWRSALEDSFLLCASLCKYVCWPVFVDVSRSTSLHWAL